MNNPALLFLKRIYKIIISPSDFPLDPKKGIKGFLFLLGIPQVGSEHPDYTSGGSLVRSDGYRNSNAHKRGK